MGAAHAAITTTSITSPSDPSYFYDPYGGAVDSNNNALGGFTVTGTTDSTQTSTDQVDIDCFQDDNGSTGVAEGILVSDVSLASDGSFSAFVPYASIEGDVGYVDPDCILRAVPAGTEPADSSPINVATFSGPRVFLAYLGLDWGNTSPYDYYIVAPQPDATDVYSSTGDCGLEEAFLNDPTYFGSTDSQSFACNDTTNVLAGAYPYPPYEGGELEVDGNQAYTPYYATLPPGSPGLTVSATQDPTDGDMTIQEGDPLYVCTVEDPSGNYCDTYGSAGVTEDRTIYQSESGKVVLITDSFVSTDGGAHSVTLELENQQCFQSSPACEEGDFNPAGVAYEFPGQDSFSTYADTDSVAVGSQTPASIYIEQANGWGQTNNEPTIRRAVDESAVTGEAPYGAITYFTAPTSSFTLQAPYEFSCCYFQNSFISTWDVSVPANGSAKLSFGYSTDSTLALVQDVDVPEVISLEQSPPISGASTTTTPTAPTTYTSPSTTGTSTTIQSQQRTFSGPTYHPVADTGLATHLRRRAWRLNGGVTAGSGPVSYYFEFGTTTHYGHRTKAEYLAAGDSMKPVALLAHGLHAGKTYHYRLVAVGAGGHAIGADRKFTVGQS